MKLVKIPIDQAEARLYTVHAEIAEPNGRSFIRFVCPFCGERIKAYVWSLWGGGKRCPHCRAFFSGKTGKGYRDLVPAKEKCGVFKPLSPEAELAETVKRQQEMEG